MLSNAESAVDMSAASAAAKMTTTSQYPAADCSMIRAHSRASTWSVSTPSMPGITTRPVRPQSRAMSVVVSGMKAITARDRFNTRTLRLA